MDSYKAPPPAPFCRVDLAYSPSGTTMTGQYAKLFILFFISKAKITVFLDIKVKSPCHECKILIYRVIFLEVYLSNLELI